MEQQEARKLLFVESFQPSSSFITSTPAVKSKSTSTTTTTEIASFQSMNIPITICVEKFQPLCVDGNSMLLTNTQTANKSTAPCIEIYIENPPEISGQNKHRLTTHHSDIHDISYKRFLIHKKSTSTQHFISPRLKPPVLRSHLKPPPSSSASNQPKSWRRLKMMLNNLAQGGRQSSQRKKYQHRRDDVKPPPHSIINLSENVASASIRKSHHGRVGETSDVTISSALINTLKDVRINARKDEYNKKFEYIMRLIEMKEGHLSQALLDHIVLRTGISPAVIKYWFRTERHKYDTSSGRVRKTTLSSMKSKKRFKVDDEEGGRSTFVEGATHGQASAEIIALDHVYCETIVPDKLGLITSTEMSIINKIPTNTVTDLQIKIKHLDEVVKRITSGTQIIDTKVTSPQGKPKYRRTWRKINGLICKGSKKRKSRQMYPPFVVQHDGDNEL